MYRPLVTGNRQLDWHLRLVQLEMLLQKETPVSYNAGGGLGVSLRGFLQRTSHQAIEIASSLDIGIFIFLFFFTYGTTPLFRALPLVARADWYGK